jgi:serine/threonine protein kinase
MDLHPPVDIGTDFLGYRIEELIGRGGMGVVYRAYDLRLKRSVAVKFVAPSLALDERFRERFARETELVMSLEHPNVVPIYDAGDVEGSLYLAMRLVEGPDLGSLLRVEGALEPDRAVAICAQIASALDAAHARGLVHRDVKPSNVLLDGSEHVYLADFGLTRSLGNAIAESGEERSIGTPAYLAPEQLEGLAVDGRADIYSLGCVIYECLTGERVFPRDSRLAEAWAHLEEEPPRASRTRRGLPEQVDRVISRALAKEPAERYPTCGALVAAAERELGPPSVRRRALLAGVIVAVAAVAAVALAIGIGHESTHGLLPDSLVRIDPKSLKATEVAAQVGDAPDIVVESGGYLWVTSNIMRDSSASSIRNAGDRTLTRVDPATGQATPVGGGLSPCGLASDPSGDVWVANCFPSGTGQPSNVVRVNARTLKFSQQISVPGGTGFVRSLVWGDGYLWAADSPSGSSPYVPAITRVDPQTGKKRRIPVRAACADGCLLGWSGSHGDLWVGSTGSLTRVNGTTGTGKRIDSDVLDAAGVPESDVRLEPSSVVVDGDVVWVSDWSAPQVVRVSAAGPARPERIPLPVLHRRACLEDSCVWRLAAGAGFIWATTPRDAALWRIDPKTNAVKRIHLPYVPTGVAADAHNVWVTVRGKSCGLPSADRSC